LVANQEAQALAAQTVAEGAGAQAPASDLLAEAAAASLAEASAPDVKTKLLLLAQSTDNLAKAMSNEDLTALGQEVVEDYDKDKTSRHDWEEMAEEMLALAAQDKPTEAKTTPWSNSSNVNVPLLTIAALQFNARMYPAAIKGDEAILCKVIGQDNGVPKKMPNPVHGVVQSVPQMDEQTGQPVRDEQGKIVPVWQVPPGGKAARARRVSDYLNTVVFYRMEGWEADTDALLTQLPIIGCAFRKVWWHAKKGACSAMVSALRVVVNENVRDLDTAPRITEEIPDTYFHEIRCKQREGVYLDIDLPISDDDEDKPRLFLEQHRWLDLDDDGYDEPYIVTVDKESRLVLRVESNFSPRDIEWSPDETKPVRITAGKFYIKYGFFPHPQGKFYDIGLGHLLKRVGAVIDTCINQLIDAGTAQTAGGGFIASGLRLQGRSGRSVVKFAPGEYKTVEVSGDDLRRSIVDRTMPEVSPTTFQVLDFIMGFAREIGGFKDILTGQASATAPVGTVLAQIEQGLQVFNAVAKRFFRAAKDEYQLLYDKIGRYGGPAAAQDYGQVLDDAGADFAADFSSDDLDIRPVSDASAVTRMQKLAKAQYLESKMGAVASVGGDVREILRRSLEAADVEDIDKILPPPKPQPPNPLEVANLNKIVAATGKDAALAQKANADAVATTVEAQGKKYLLEHQAMADGAKAAHLG
jgi:chaperonin GroES